MSKLIAKEKISIKLLGLLRKVAVISSTLFALMNFIWFWTLLGCYKYLADIIVFDFKMPNNTPEWFKHNPVIEAIIAYPLAFITICFALGLVLSLYCYFKISYIHLNEKWPLSLKFWAVISSCLSGIVGRGFNYLFKFVRGDEYLWSNPLIGEVRQKLSVEKIESICKQNLQNFCTEQNLTPNEAEFLANPLKENLTEIYKLFEQGSKKATAVLNSMHNDDLIIFRDMEASKLIEVVNPQTWFEYLQPYGVPILLGVLGITIIVGLWFINSQNKQFHNEKVRIYEENMANNAQLNTQFEEKLALFAKKTEIVELKTALDQNIAATTKNASDIVKLTDSLKVTRDEVDIKITATLGATSDVMTDAFWQCEKNLPNIQEELLTAYNNNCDMLLPTDVQEFVDETLRNIV